MSVSSSRSKTHAISADITFVTTKVLTILFVQCGFEDGFGELFAQAVRPGQRQALFLRQPDQLRGRDCFRGGWLGLFFVTSSSVIFNTPTTPAW